METLTNFAGAMGILAVCFAGLLLCAVIGNLIARFIRDPERAERVRVAGAVVGVVAFVVILIAFTWGHSAIDDEFLRPD